MDEATYAAFLEGYFLPHPARSRTNTPTRTSSRKKWDHSKKK
jgi:hypothetical protein